MDAGCFSCLCMLKLYSRCSKFSRFFLGSSTPALAGHKHTTTSRLVNQHSYLRDQSHNEMTGPTKHTTPSGTQEPPPLQFFCVFKSGNREGATADKIREGESTGLELCRIAKRLPHLCHTYVTTISRKSHANRAIFTLLIDFELLVCFQVCICYTMHFCSTQDFEPEPIVGVLPYRVPHT
jgi:hypothetical protein